MCRNEHTTCAECGSPILTATSHSGYTCDNCDAPICDSCWGALQSVHVTKPTKSGLVGFVKFCKDCRIRTDSQSVTPNPFIG